MWFFHAYITTPGRVILAAKGSEHVLSWLKWVLLVVGWKGRGQEWSIALYRTALEKTAIVMIGNSACNAFWCYCYTAKLTAVQCFPPALLLWLHFYHTNNCQFHKGAWRWVRWTQFIMAVDSFVNVSGCHSTMPQYSVLNDLHAGTLIGFELKDEYG